MACLSAASFLSLATIESKLIPELSGMVEVSGRGGVRADATGGGRAARLRAGDGKRGCDPENVRECKFLSGEWEPVVLGTDASESSCMCTTSDSPVESAEGSCREAAIAIEDVGAAGGGGEVSELRAGGGFAAEDGVIS